MLEEQLFYVGDTPLIKIDCLYDISAASLFEIHYKKPDGVIGKWVGDLSGTQYIEYQTVSDEGEGTTDLDVVGIWLIQAFVDWGVIEKYGNTATFEIHEMFTS